ncbi:LAQU0S11e02564g1_1 [Lachancea quebecensis]|uniref:LAQU0S11e02564g1_1 n=1 Tax=Lachancea quebecensis TaxID=1654605 RepID=A0A0P1KUX8_9SACH|nr:LAQU0S11e02564g1_1 [Lachancea quebecensis]
MAVNRLTFGMERVPRYGVMSKWKVSDALLCVIFFLINIPIYHADPFQRQFYVNDPTLSHPHATNQRVSENALLGYSLALPATVIIIVTLLIADPKHKLYLLYVSLLGLVLSWTFTSLLTDYLKNWIGRPRPDFIARCKPKKGTPLDTLVTASDTCTTKNLARLMDGFRSTPSGHSSESFAGLGYLYLWLSGQLLTENPKVSFWRSVVACAPLIGAATIAISRTEDYRHHFVDVLLGSVIGLVIAYKTYFRNFPAISSETPFKPLLDDSDVSLQASYNISEERDEEALPLREG